jgi:hypothetical protein
MKKTILIIALICSSLSNFASSEIVNENISLTDINEQPINISFQNPKSFTSFKDCTVRLDFELADGSTIEGEITFEDVSWWECSKMQLGAWWARNF